MTTRKKILIPTSKSSRALTTGSPTGSHGKNKGSYCQLVNDLDRPQDLYCTECSTLMFDPQQVTCCAKNYCLDCVENITSYQIPCGNCKATSYFHCSNTELKNMVAKMRVHCPNYDKGCLWVGSPRRLMDHLGSSDDANSAARNYCRFTKEAETKYKCPHCSEQIVKSQLQKHIDHTCNLRPHTCKFCNEYKSTFRDVTYNHEKKCNRVPVPCPNQCGETVLKVDLDNHVINDCPKKKIKCDFAPIGCPDILSRFEYSKHSDNAVVYHLHLVARKLKEMEITEAKLKDEVSKLKERNQKLEKNLEELQAKVPAQDEAYSTVPMPHPHNYRLPESAVAEFTIKNISKLKRDNTVWSSPPFYTAQRGHRLYLQVTINGQGQYKGKCISVSIYKSIGEFDDQLPSQFEGTLALHIVDEKHKVPAYRVVTTIENDMNQVYANVMTSSYLDSSPLKAIHDFADHRILSTHVSKDSLVFIVTRVNL